jgi:phosphoribosyl-AMP cyclohydrolase
MSIMAKPFAPRGTSENIERSDVFQPKFDADGLIPAIVTDSVTGAVLMFAFMNEAALIITLETSHAHFWSRSRKQLWKKGEESGNILAVGEIRTDCDQDVLWRRCRLPHGRNVVLLSRPRGQAWQWRWRSFG